MVTSLYLASAEPETGKSSVALGVLNLFSRRLGRVGVFRPIMRHADRPDYVLHTLIQHGGVQQRYEDAAGITYDEVHQGADAALAKVVGRFHEVAAKYDAVLVVGSDFTDVAQPAELEFNARVAANIGAPVALIVNGFERTPDQVRDVVEVASLEVESNHADLLAVVVNRADGDLAAVAAEAQLGVTHHRSRKKKQKKHVPQVYAIPSEPLLAAATISQLMDSVNGRFISGDPDLLNNESTGIMVAAMTLPRVLDRLTDGVTVVTPGDRSDVVLGVLTAHASQTFPSLSALVLNGGVPLEDSLARLIDGIPTRLPIITTEYGTHETSTRLVRVKGRLTPDASRKIERALALFERHVDSETLLARLQVSDTDVVTPMMFEYRLTQTARSQPTTIVLPEGAEERILRAAEILLTRKVANLILLGDPGEIRRVAGQLGVNIEGAELIDPHDPALVEEFSAKYAELRAHRGVTLDAARDRVVDVSYFGTMLVLTGRADGMVSGAVHTTAHTIRPAIELLRDPGTVKTVSSAFFMCLQDRVLVFADCAIVPDPTAEQLADIAISSYGTAAAFDIDPRMALLSYSTGTSGTGDEVEKVKQATSLVKERRPELVVDGPLQYDAAVDPEVAATKMPDSPVAGNATVLIFPDLNTGNNTYKAVQRSANAVAVGPVLQGLRSPVNDLSRGATVLDIVNTVAMTAVQAQKAAAAGSATAPQPPTGPEEK